MKKLTTEEFIEKAKQVHDNEYDYSKANYISTRLKLVITCLKHGDFKLTPGMHLQGQGCPTCRYIKMANSRRLTTKEFIQKAKEIHKNKYDYNKTDYVETDKKVCITCPEHGDFFQRPSDHLSGKGCSKCANNIKHTKEDFIDLSRAVHGDKYNYSKVNYINNKTKVCIVCPIHEEFYMTPDLHINQKQGCRKCGIESRAKKKTHTTEEFIELATKVHGDKYDYSQSEYIHGHKKLKIICKNHGEFYQTPNSHLSGQGCPKCLLKSQTKVFQDLCSYFKDEEILFEVGRKIIPWIKQYRIDIYFPDYNIAVEYDGKQHFENVPRFSKYEDDLLLIQKRDILKNKLCEENNCKLFRLRYDYTLSDFLDLVTNIQNIIKNGHT